MSVQMVPAQPGFRVVLLVSGCDSVDEALESGLCIYEVIAWLFTPKWSIQAAITVGGVFDYDEVSLYPSYKWIIQQPNGVLVDPFDQDYHTLREWVEGNWKCDGAQDNTSSVS